MLWKITTRVCNRTYFLKKKLLHNVFSWYFCFTNFVSTPFLPTVLFLAIVLCFFSYFASIIPLCQWIWCDVLNVYLLLMLNHRLYSSTASPIALQSSENIFTQFCLVYIPKQTFFVSYLKNFMHCLWQKQRCSWT